MNVELTPFEHWMVRSNLQSIQGGADAAERLDLLRVNGYSRVAGALEKTLHAFNKRASDSATPATSTRD